MADPTNDGRVEPPLDVDALMRRVREEAERRRSDAPVSEPRRNPYVVEPDPLARTSPRHRIRVKDAYTMAEFLRYEDEQFVRNAYIGVLRRAPDPDGLEHYVSALRTGQLGKIDVLARLRYSAEGRERAVPVAGLRRAALYRRVRGLPVVGYLAAWLNHLLRLPRLAESTQRMDSEIRSRLTALEAKLNEVDGQLAMLGGRVDRAEAMAEGAAAVPALTAGSAELALADPSLSAGAAGAVRRAGDTGTVARPDHRGAAGRADDAEAIVAH